jgi:hypothetical protein
MVTTELLRRAKERLDSLSPDRLRVADDFLAFLEERESDEATTELMSIPGFLEAFERAEQEIQAGHLIPLEQLRRKE